MTTGELIGYIVCVDFIMTLGWVLMGGEVSQVCRVILITVLIQLGTLFVANVIGKWLKRYVKGR
jgi:hypothetical protein